MVGWIWVCWSSEQWWGQGDLACCSSWSRKESDSTERLSNNNNKQNSFFLKLMRWNCGKTYSWITALTIGYMHLNWRGRTWKLMIKYNLTSLQINLSDNTLFLVLINTRTEIKKVSWNIQHTYKTRIYAYWYICDRKYALK